MPVGVEFSHNSITTVATSTVGMCRGALNMKVVSLVYFAVVDVFFYHPSMHLLKVHTL